MGKIILNLAMSLDGYILDKDGKYDWIQGDGDNTLNTPDVFDFPTFTKSLDIVVMGRKSYDDIGVDDYKDKKIIVATTKQMKNYDNLEFVGENVVEYVHSLKDKVAGDIWLFGGGVLVDAFLKADIIDKFILGIVPIILGDGTPMFYKGIPETKLHLDKYTMQEGVTILEYSRR